MMRKQPHRSKRRLLPEFGKIDAPAKTLSRSFVGSPTQVCLQRHQQKQESGFPEKSRDEGESRAAVELWCFHLK
jgi:hypothetical protein